MKFYLARVFILLVFVIFLSLKVNASPFSFLFPKPQVESLIKEFENVKSKEAFTHFAKKNSFQEIYRKKITLLSSAKDIDKKQIERDTFSRGQNIFTFEESPLKLLPFEKNSITKYFHEDEKNKVLYALTQNTFNTIIMDRPNLLPQFQVINFQVLNYSRLRIEGYAFIKEVINLNQKSTKNFYLLSFQVDLSQHSYPLNVEYHYYSLSKETKENDLKILGLKQ